MTDKLTQTQTQHGCTATGFTSTIPRTYTQNIAEPEDTEKSLIVSVTIVTSVAGPTLPNPADVPLSTYTEVRYWYTAPPSNLGAIVGGAVGGFAALSITAFGIFFVRRKVKKDKARQSLAAAEAHLPPLGETAGKDHRMHERIAHSELPEHSVAEMSQPPQELDGGLIEHETSTSPIKTRRPLI